MVFSCRDLVINHACQKLMELRMQSPTGRAPHKQLQGLVDWMKHFDISMSKQSLSSRAARLQRKGIPYACTIVHHHDDNNSMISDLDSVDSYDKPHHPRPRLSEPEPIDKEMQTKIKKARQHIISVYKEKRKRLPQGKRLPKYYLSGLIHDVRRQFAIPDWVLFDERYIRFKARATKKES